MRFAPLILIFLLFGCSPKEPKEGTVPLPKIDKPVTLSVIYAENPRFEPLHDEEIEMLLHQARLASKIHLDSDVRFKLLPPTTVEALFSHLRPKVKQARQSEIFDFRHGDDPDKLTEAFAKELGQVSHATLDEMITYATPHLDRLPKEKRVDAFAKVLSDTLLERFGMWQRVVAKDGKRAIDDSPYNEWIYWDSLGYDTLPFDIVITNTPVASIEYYGQDIHSALRGGLTVGTTTNALSRPYGSYIFWSTFAFTNNAPLLHRLRGNKDYSREEAIMLSGTYLTHEIGHLLFHYGHPYENGSCIMSPVPMLYFHKWAAGLDAKACGEANPPAMQKGAVKIYYRKDWY